MDWQPHTQSFNDTPSTSLPDLVLALLPSWGAIDMVGADKKAYLQGQVTCDVVTLAKEESTLGAHCDAKGKVWSIFRLCNTHSGYTMIQPRSIIAKEQAELSKYAVFSKVDISMSDNSIAGIIGAQSHAFVSTLFPTKGDVRTTESATAIKVSDDRWMIVAPSAWLEENLNDDALAWGEESLWTRLDIEQGLPTLTPDLQNQHIPQAFNLQALGGISFTKGCYTGQETVARAKYRGINKRMLMTLSGVLSTKLSDSDSVDVERSVGENWRKAGDTLAFYQFSDGTTLVSAILPNNLDTDTEFRLMSSPEDRLTPTALPYSTDDE
ncbi:tRNA-modifying protein YgfZ [Vibrio methylphosphonaticus]|uniref:tRNA-modifying protein YgfZ n=1 Tax=Vibrio methylphosphonaticus TaxID=2946866 RepID=UPI00202A41D5|nr:tRNA-modifying protein YgfZ [Vibrio methylphosphonaticus]MCL9773469.1 tRNA-modifying protein YgfZ [Vibrio methylphosphonaticus]